MEPSFDEIYKKMEEARHEKDGYSGQPVLVEPHMFSSIEAGDVTNIL